MAPCKTSILVSVLLGVLPSRVQCLWPIPKFLQQGSSALQLAEHFDFEVHIPSPPKDLVQAVSQTRFYLDHDKHERLVVGRSASDRGIIQDAPCLSSVVLSLEHGLPVSSISEEALLQVGTRSESYSILLPSDGSAGSITANSTLGLYRGLTTFSQLWYDLEGMTYTLEAPIHISDHPSYPYRGLMLDTARNFFPVPDIKRTLDSMSWVKLNTFHWHIVDSQSFPLEADGFHELSERGAYSAAQVYTEQDVQDVVAYAAARGIDVLMEIDTPGHTAAIAASHPEHIACPFSSPWTRFANQPPSGQLRLASPVTTAFTVSLLTAIARSLPSTLFSTGGDEINENCYANDLPTQIDLLASGRTFEQALDEFTKATHDALAEEGKTAVVWEDLVLDHDVTLSNNTIVMVWRSPSRATHVASKNLRIIHAPSDYFYLDCGAGGWLGNTPFGSSWCPFNTWQKAYTFDPLAHLTKDQWGLVLGGQQLLWTEQTSPENLDSMVWPRAASSAEVFWTGANLPDGTPRNVASALPRLHDLRYRMVRRGVRAIALQPEWCALRPNACDFNA